MLPFSCRRTSFFAWRAMRLLFVALLSLCGLVGCSTVRSSSTSVSEECTNPGCMDGAAGQNDHLIDLGTPPGASGGSESVGGADACGIDISLCEPDDPLACAADGLALDAGTAGQAAAAASSACQIARVDEVVRSSCESAGLGTRGAPCISAADCAAQHTCVEQSGTAQCRPYCCGDPELCPVGTYCAKRPKRELDVGTEELLVMACVPAEACRFDEPFPCDGTVTTCSCPLDKTCGLVRSDGTTACVTPGSGMAGQACPCAAGHVCSASTNTCLEVCSLSDPSACGDSGECQATVNLSREWGVCVTTLTLGD